MEDDGAPNKREWKKHKGTLRHCYFCNTVLDDLTCYYVTDEEGRMPNADEAKRSTCNSEDFISLVVKGYSINKKKRWEEVESGEVDVMYSARDSGWNVHSNQWQDTKKGGIKRYQEPEKDTQNTSQGS
jgi:hypothetical protein